MTATRLLSTLFLSIALVLTPVLDSPILAQGIRAGLDYKVIVTEGGESKEMVCDICSYSFSDNETIAQTRLRLTLRMATFDCYLCGDLIFLLLSVGQPWTLTLLRFQPRMSSQLTTISSSRSGKDSPFGSEEQVLNSRSSTCLAEAALRRSCANGSRRVAHI